MFRALKPNFRSLATLKLVVNDVGELLAEADDCGIARFCDSRAFLLGLTVKLVFPRIHGDQASFILQSLIFPATPRTCSATIITLLHELKNPIFAAGFPLFLVRNTTVIAA